MTESTTPHIPLEARGPHTEVNEDRAVLQHPGYEVRKCIHCGRLTVTVKDFKEPNCGFHDGRQKS